MREIDGVDPDYIASSAAGRLTTPINEPRRCAMSASAIQTRPAQLHELGRYLFESWKHDHNRLVLPSASPVLSRRLGA